MQRVAQAHGAFSNVACHVLHRRMARAAMSLAKCCTGAWIIQRAAQVHGPFNNAACQVLRRRMVHSAKPLAKRYTIARCIQPCRLPSAAQARTATYRVISRILCGCANALRRQMEQAGLLSDRCSCKVCFHGRLVTQRDREE